MVFGLNFVENRMVVHCVIVMCKFGVLSPRFIVRSFRFAISVCVLVCQILFEMIRGVIQSGICLKPSPF